MINNEQNNKNTTVELGYLILDKDGETYFTNATITDGEGNKRIEKYTVPASYIDKAILDYINNPPEDAEIVSEERELAVAS